MPTLTAPSPAVVSDEFAELIAGVRRAVRAQPDPAAAGRAVAELLRPHLGSCEFLTAEQLEPDETKYRQHVLHVEPDGSFSIVALVWLPGQATAVHDHVSWCVVGVHRGEEHETIYRLAGGEEDPHLVVTGRTISPAGSVAALVPPGDIHRVKNGGEAVAVSLHIYGADIGKLGSSIRRHYHLEIR